MRKDVKKCLYPGIFLDASPEINPLKKIFISNLIDSHSNTHLKNLRLKIILEYSLESHGEISIDVIVYCCQTIQFRYNIGRYYVYYAKFKMFEKWNLFHQVDNDCDIFWFLSVVYLPTLHIWKNTTPCLAEIKAGVQFLEWRFHSAPKFGKKSENSTICTIICLKGSNLDITNLDIVN